MAFRREEFQRHLVYDKLDAHQRSKSENDTRAIQMEERQDVELFRLKEKQARRESMAFRRTELQKQMKVDEANRILKQRAAKQNLQAESD
jgi:hypothetical protein